MLIKKQLLYIFCYLSALTLIILIKLNKPEFILPFMLSLSSALLITALINRRAPFISTLLLFAYTAVISLQTASVWHTGQYTEVLTLENLDDFYSIDRRIIFETLLIFALFAFPPLALKSKKDAKISPNWYLWLIPALILPFYEKTPALSFLNTSYHWQKQAYFKENLILKNRQKALYAKDTFFKQNTADVPDLSGKNIIILFSEGLSLETLDGFSPYQDLTPNISRFIAGSVWFDNYHNHTSATYRGLRGQLSSSYQYIGGLNKTKITKTGFSQIKSSKIKKALKDTVISLPDILKQNGYHSYFLSAHPKNHSLNTYLSELNFDKVFTANDFIKEDQNLSDQQLMQYLINLLASKKLKEPFIMGIYNIGTHYGMHSPDIVYSLNGKTDNDLLNVIHNYDNAFQKLISFINNTNEQKEKTAVILTADHATYHSELYQQTFNDRRNCFLSRIPFAVYYPGIPTKKYDAAGRNSLDMAPTLLNMMRISTGHNYFLGCSLFDTSCPYPFEHIYNAGNTFFQTYPNNKESCTPVTNTKIIQDIKDFYHLSDNRRAQ